ncbi:MAG: hypothetical protein HW421_3568 [Ignavibacteria bacterium]|nr:hypothetical protein [Ignavibacteria bacterium]
MFLRLLISLFVFIFFTCNGFAIFPNNISLPIIKKNIAYRIVQPGKQNSDGTLSASRVFEIERVSQQDLIPNTIHLKTKKIYYLEENAKGFYSSALQSSLSALGVESLRAPFAEFSTGNLLSADVEGISRIYELRYTAPIDVYDACQELMKNPEVEYAVPVFMRYTYDFVPNDDIYKQNKQYGLKKISMEKAWDISKGDKTVIIGIVDSGVDWQHEDLSGNIWTNTKEIAGNGKDDDGNGKIDDIRGWDFVGNITYNEYGNWKEDNDPKNTGTGANQVHGTHVAGCAAAMTNNFKGVAGPASNCLMLPVKCGSDNNSVGGIFRGYEGISYAAKMGAQIINCSWGGPGASPAEQDIINQATNMGALVVVAAGNDGKNIDQSGQYPACYDNVLCVGASNSSDRVASFSNYGNLVTVYTPGQGIWATLPNNKYGSQDGTSMASPITAGVAALVKAFHPDWTPKQIIHQIRSTCDNVLTSDESKRPIYFGRLNAFKALDYNSSITALNQTGGVEISAFKFETGTSLTDYNWKNVDLTLTNYLNNILNLKLTITPLHDYITCSTNGESFGLMKTMQSKTLKLQLKLQPNNPWFSGEAYLLFTYEGDNYKDYQIVKIPIKISSQNIFTNVSTLPDYLNVNWLSSHSPSKGVFWSAGTSAMGGVYYKYNSSQASFNIVSTSDVMSSICGIDGNRACAGTGSQSGNTNIYYTTNSGINWYPFSIKSITNFVNNIHFFDDNNGFFLGDPYNSKWGAGFTSNGGKNWQQSNALMPTPLDSEASVNTAYYWRGDRCWFGTTKGKIISSANRGANWTGKTFLQNAPISFVCFRSDAEGIVVYSESKDPSSPLYLASTVDNGNNWTLNQFSFTSVGLKPVNFFAVDSSKTIVGLFSGGEVLSTTDLGSTWNSVLSTKLVGAQTGTGAATKLNVRMWSAASKISFLDFKVQPSDIRRGISLSTNSLKYDTIEVSKNKTLIVDMKNNGNVDMNLYEYSITPLTETDSTEFVFQVPPVKTLPAGDSTKVRLKFLPKSKGEKSAIVKIVSDAAPDSVVYINLLGYGKITVGVDEETPLFQPSIAIYPNPCQTEAKMEISTIQPGYLNVDLFDLNGSLISNIYDGSADYVKTYIPLNFTCISNGVYNLKIQLANEVYLRKIVIVK